MVHLVFDESLHVVCTSWNSKMRGKALAEHLAVLAPPAVGEAEACAADIEAQKIHVCPEFLILQRD